MSHPYKVGHTVSNKYGCEAKVIKVTTNTVTLQWKGHPQQVGYKTKTYKAGELRIWWQNHQQGHWNDLHYPT